MMVLVPIITVEAVLEYSLTPGYTRQESVIGFLSVIPRLKGVLGDPNYCGILYGFLAFTLYSARRTGAAMFLFGLGLLTVSRGYALALVSAVSIGLLRRAPGFLWLFWILVSH